MSQGALDGLKVLEFGEFVSAPYCAKLMADLGADVIKVEHPADGDESRAFGPFRGDLPDREASGVFAYLNANKRGVTLDPSTRTGARLFKDLVRWADVLVENQQPGVLETLGLTYAELGRVNEGLVMTSISTFGRSGPYSGYKGYDLAGWHGSGIGTTHLGNPAREPLRGAWRHMDHWGAIGGAAGTMLALYARDVVHEGQQVDMSSAQMAAAMIMGYQTVTIYRKTGQFKVRTGGGHGQNAPAGMFPCKDGFIFIFAFEMHHWHGFVKALGEPEWAKDPLFQGAAWERAKYAHEIHTWMQPWLDSHTKLELFDLLQGNRVPSGPVNHAKDLMEHPHLEARGFFSEAKHPVWGEVKAPGRPYVLSGTPWSMRGPAPLLGQHNEEVYRAMGLRREDLTDLRRAGVI